MAEPDDPPEPDPEPQQPRAPRTNLLLSATIETESLNAPVRIRNLSESGAMIDGAVFPSVGATLTLRRLDMTIEAIVVWCDGGRCGIRFDGKASVPDWVAGASRADAGAMRGQLRVDAIQAALRTGGQQPIVAARPPTEPHSDHVADERLADELAFVRRLLEAVGDELADDPVVLQRYMRPLQDLDIAGQIIEQLAAVLRAADRGQAVAAVTMGELRARLLRKPMF